MRKFLAECVVFAAVQAALIGLLLWRGYSAEAVSPLAPATVVKHARLNEASSPRMILVGGSNLLFGIDSTLIERDTGFNPVNMGLIGGLRLEYILNEVQDEVRPGDLVVLSIEYNTLNAALGEEETQVMLAVAMRRPASVRILTWPQWRSVLDQGAIEYVGVVFRQAFGDLGGRDRRDDSILDHMNAFGDMTRYHDPAEPFKKGNSQNTITRIHPERVAANIQRMNAFIDRCSERGVRVVFAYPPIPRTHYDRARQVARRFDRQLRRELHAPVIVEPQDMVFDDGDFIGLSYHLRGAAVQERTNRLIDAVRREQASREGK